VAKFVHRVAGPLPITREIRTLCENPDVLVHARQGVLDEKHVNLFRQPNPLNTAAEERNAVLAITELPLTLTLEQDPSVWTSCAHRSTRSPHGAPAFRRHSVRKTAGPC